MSVVSPPESASPTPSENKATPISTSTSIGRGTRGASGAIELIGEFETDAQVASVSGPVMLRFTPAASVHIDATSLSGDVNASGLGLVGQATAPHSFSGTLATGGPTVSVHTTSGNIQLLRAG